MDAGADVLNLSLGAREESSAVEAALDYAQQHGVVVIASGGRVVPDIQEETDVAFPAEEEPSLAVTAVDSLFVAPPWVVHDDDIALAAPGVICSLPIAARVTRE